MSDRSFAFFAAVGTVFSKGLVHSAAMRTARGFKADQAAEKDNDRSKPNICPSVALKIAVVDHQAANVPRNDKDNNGYYGSPFCYPFHTVTLL